MESFDFCNCVQPRSIKLAIVGRLSVGKSTLHNKIVHNDRVFTGPEYVMKRWIGLGALHSKRGLSSFFRPKVTRDLVKVPWSNHGRPHDLTVETASIRRHSKRNHDDQIYNLLERDAIRAVKS